MNEADYAIRPHPKDQWTWLLTGPIVPHGLWYKDLKSALSYAEGHCWGTLRRPIRIFDYKGELLETRLPPEGEPARGVTFFNHWP